MAVKLIQILSLFHQFAEKTKADATPSPSRQIPTAWKSTPTALSPPERTFSTFGKASSAAGDTSMIGPSLPRGLSLQQATYESMESLGPSRPVQGPSMPAVSHLLLVYD